MSSIPRHGVEREYALGLATPLDRAQADALRDGIPLDEGLATLHALRPMTEVETQRLEDLLRPSPSPDLTWYRATLTQGWKRQLRRMFGAVGAPVQRLVRVRIGPVRIDGLRSAAIRPLKAPEIRGLGAGAGRSRAASSGVGGNKPPASATSAPQPGGRRRPAGPRPPSDPPSPANPRRPAGPRPPTRPG